MSSVPKKADKLNLSLSIYRYRKIYIDYRSKFSYRFISSISIIYSNTNLIPSHHINSFGHHALCWTKTWSQLPACGWDCQKPCSAQFASDAGFKWLFRALLLPPKPCIFSKYWWFHDIGVFFIFGTACQIYCYGRYCVRRSVSPQVPENPSGPLVDNFIVLPCVAFGVTCVKLLPGVDRWNSLDEPRVIGPCHCEVWGWHRH